MDAVIIRPQSIVEVHQGMTVGRLRVNTPVIRQEALDTKSYITRDIAVLTEPTAFQPSLGKVVKLRFDGRCVAARIFLTRAGGLRAETTGSETVSLSQIVIGLGGNV